MNRAGSAISDSRASLGALPAAAGIDMKPRLGARIISVQRQRRDSSLACDNAAGIIV